MLSRGARFTSRAVLAACVGVVGWVWFSDAGAQAPGAAMSSSSSCPAGNLVAGKQPSQWQDLRGSAALVTDGAVAPEGAQWDAPVGVTFETGAGSLTYDLGQPTAISAVYMQGDANDSYKILGSIDGTPGSYKLLIEIDNAMDRGHGLRIRSAQIPPMTVRFIRIGEGVGDGFYSISEFGAWCQVPFPFPPQFRQVDAQMANVAKAPWQRFEWWEDHASARFEMWLAIAACFLLAWYYWNEKTQKDFAIGPAVPHLVLALSVAIHLALAFMLRSYNVAILPGWAPIIVCWLCIELTIWVAPAAARWPTPLRLLARALDRRSKAARAKSGAAASGTARLAVPAATIGETVRNQLLVMVGILSFFAYFNFGAFHFGNYVHYWDTYHYYVGSKYFKELSYDRLYDCASIADAEDPSLRRRVEVRKIMNLRTNYIVGTSEVLAHPEHCKQHFTPQRWENFKKDVEFFRNRLGVKRWEEAQTDHGYNATPVWTILGAALTNMGPATDTQMGVLTKIDPAFIVGITLMIWWAFGWRVLCVALCVFATNFPSRFYWTGGAYLRWDWLFHMVAGVCFVKKEKPLIGGFLLCYSALLRVFPGFLLLGPLFVIVQQLLAQTKGRPWWQRLPPAQLPGLIRKVDRSFLRVMMGALLAVVTLVPLSLATTGGVDAYRTFVWNSKKHTSTPLTNYMGWRTVITYKEQESGRYLQSNRLEDPWKDWKDARLRAFHHRKWAYAAGIIAFAAFLYHAMRGFSAWESTALASMMIAMVPELTCYYYSFLMVVALLWQKRREVGITLLLVTASTGFIDWAPTQYMPWKPIQGIMPTWLDQQYTHMSITTLIGFLYILYEFGFVSRAAAAAPVMAASLAGGGTTESPAPAPSPPGGGGGGGGGRRRQNQSRRKGRR